MSYVYLAPLSDKSAFKVGKANAPSTRLSQLLHFYEFDVPKIVIINCGNIGGAFTLETILHKACESRRVILPGDGGTEFFSYELLESATQITNIICEISGFRKTNFIGVKQDPVDETSLIIQSFASKIRARRLELNISQSELADRAAVGKRTIERLEANGNCNFGNLVAVLRELGLEYLFSGLEIDEPVRRRANRRLS